MRKVLLLCLLLSGIMTTKAQFNTEQNRSGNAPTGPVKRCYTMEELEYKMKHDPVYKRAIEENQRKWEEMQRNGTSYRTEACQPLADTVIIPLVLHVVGPTTLQTTVTDAVLQSQVDVLNEDFQGSAANLAKTPAHFQPLFGTSKFKFVLAKRNQYDEPFNGVIRKVASVSYSTANYDNVKLSSAGGSDALNPNNFMNIWITTLTGGLLGVSVFPGDPKPLPLHGFVCDYRVFGRGYAHLYTDYNGGRTTTHELGHFFNLFHIWGDDVSGAYGCPTPACSSSDFRPNNLRPGLVLGTDDTPNQCGATSTVVNTTNVVTDACSASGSGINYQNYMDYTVDRGLTMFTKGQMERVMGCFASNDRGPILCGNGYIPPVERNFDANLRAVVNPDSLNAYCGSIVPSIIVRNSGKNTITSFKVTVVQNGTTLGSQTITTSLLAYTENTFTLTAIPTGVAGSNNLVFYLSELNGTATDENLINDTSRTRYNLLTSTTAPITQGFESATFPPTNWRVINPNSGSITWVKTPSTTIASSGTGSTYINFYNYTTPGHLDYLVAPPLNAVGADSVFVSFQRAYKTYSTTPADHDTLMLMISTNCGATFPITAWKKGGNDLSTSPGTNTGNWAPANLGEWRQEKIDIRPFIGNNTDITVAFVSKNSYGNNLFLDDINISNFYLPLRDAQLVKIVDPFERLCSRILTPSIQFRNNGRDTIKTLKITYSISGGTPVTINWTGALAYNQTTTFTFPNSITLAGPGTFQVTLSEPNGLNDFNTTNDAGSVAFTIIDPVTTPVAQGFEEATFPPANWSLNRSNANYTWSKTTLAKKDGLASAWMRNRRLVSSGSRDELISPIIQPVAGADSVFVKFDVANVSNRYPGSTASPLDTLEVLLTTNCGKTYTTVYKKWGADLQTINDPNFGLGNTDTLGYIPTSTNEWRTDSVNISKEALSAPSFILVFRNINNNGNNTFLDNINITSKVVPAKVKNNGYMIAPNPFNDAFTVYHYIAPVNLKAIQVMTSSGQILVEKRFNGNAITQIPVSMSQYAAGVYIVKMIYSDKVITERIVKGK